MGGRSRWARPPGALRGSNILPLSWSETARPVADSPEAVLGQVTPAVNVVLRLAGRLENNLDRATARLAANYTRLPTGRLVILGEPGAGKSVLALMLALGLVQSRQPGQPVPVRLPLSTWDPLRHDMDSWIAESLAVSYYNGDTAIPAMLLRRQLIQPILDGLDEIPEQLRRSAIRHVNNAIGSARAVTITCRSVEYEDLIRGGAPRLHRAPVVELSPVPISDAIGYLRAVDWSGRADWDEVFESVTRNPQDSLAEAFSTPLMIVFARTVYERLGGRPAELLDSTRFESRHAVEEYLTDRVVDAAYAAAPADVKAAGERQSWNAADARRWLTFIARHLHRHRERELKWWLLSERLLSWWVGPAIGIGGGTILMTATSLWLTAMAPESRSEDIESVILSGALVGGTFAVLAIMVWFAGSGRTPGRLSFMRAGSMARLQRGFGIGFLAALTVVVPVFAGAATIITLSTGWTVATGEQFVGAAAAGLLAAVVVGIATATESWMNSHAVGAGRADPLLTMQQDRRSSCIGSAVAGLVAGLLLLPAAVTGLFAGWLVLKMSTGWAGWPGHPNIAGLIDMFVVAVAEMYEDTPEVLIGGSLVLPAVVISLLILLTRAWPRFVICRAVLALGGRLPINLPAFLDDARRRNLLRQSAGAYQFSHVRLQERLADESGAAQQGTPRGARPRRRVLRLAFGCVAALALLTILLSLPKDTATVSLSGTYGGWVYAADTLSPDRHYVAQSTDPHTVTVWSIPSGEPKGVLGGHAGVVRELKFSPDGRLVDVLTGKPDTPPEDLLHTVWDVIAKEPIVRDVRGASFLAGGKGLLVDLQESDAHREDIRVIDTARSTPQATVEGASSFDQLGLPPSASGGTFLASTESGGSALVDAVSGRVMQLLQDQGGRSVRATFDASGSVIFARTDTGLLVWNAADGRFIGFIPARSATTIEANPETHRLVVTFGQPQASNSDDDSVLLWDTRSGTQVGQTRTEPSGYGVPQFSSDGRLVVVPIPATKTALLIDTQTGQTRATLDRQASFVEAVPTIDGSAPAANAKLLVETPADLKEGGSYEVQVFDTSGRPVTTLQASAGSGSPVLGWAGSEADARSTEPSLDLLVADSSSAVAAISNGPGSARTLRVYDLGSTRTMEVRSTDIGLYSWTFSPDGHYFSCVYADKVVLWDVTSGEDLEVPLHNDSGSYTESIVAFSPDSKTATIVSNGDEKATVWDLESNNKEPLHVLTGHSGPISMVDHTKDSRMVITSGADGTVRLWPVRAN